MILHIVRGLPGTGKTTFVQKQFKGMLQIENDQYWITDKGEYKFGWHLGTPAPRAECQLYVHDMVEEAMRHGVNIAVSRCGVSHDSVKELVDLAKDFKYDSKIWVMSAENRCVFGNDIHAVPEDVFKSMKNNFVWHLPWDQTCVGLTLSEATHSADVPKPVNIEYDFTPIAIDATDGRGG